MKTGQIECCGIGEFRTVELGEYENTLRFWVNETDRVDVWIENGVLHINTDSHMHNMPYVNPISRNAIEIGFHKRA